MFYFGKKNGHVVKRSHFFILVQIMRAFVSNMEWSVSDDVNDDVMALTGVG